MWLGQDHWEEEEEEEALLNSWGFATWPVFRRSARGSLSFGEPSLAGRRRSRKRSSLDARRGRATGRGGGGWGVRERPPPFLASARPFSCTATPVPIFLHGDSAISTNPRPDIDPEIPVFTPFHPSFLASDVDGPLQQSQL